jgi:aminoglycoside phosphotransferase
MQEGLKRTAMTNNDFQQDVKNLRGVLSKEGLICFEVVGLAQDRDLVFLLAQRLSANSADASNLRLVLKQLVLSLTENKGRILASLRNSPLVGANGEIDLARLPVSDRTVEF